MTEHRNETPPLPDRVVFYDGVCGLCNGIVRFLLRVDKKGALRYAPLQGSTAALMRHRWHGVPEELDTFVFIEGDATYVRSRAVFASARHLPYPWRAIRLFRWVPRFLTDALYRLVARWRYTLFGKSDSCVAPAPEVRSRFLP
jgi:predicted DCC family thiol-disulfide oxidoreductase YuxK